MSERFLLSGRQFGDGAEKPNPVVEKVQADETSGPEKKEKKEGGENFESRYNDLAKEATAIARGREVTSHLANLQSEGIQTLMSEFGADAVFDAIREKSAEGKKNFSTLDVVKTLETDMGKREDLYEKMMIDAQGLAEQQSEKFTGKEMPRDGYFAMDKGLPPESLIHKTELKVNAMKSMDSILGKLGLNQHSDILNTSMSELASLVSRDKTAEAALKKELATADGDTYSLVEARAVESAKLSEQFHEKTDNLYEEISKEVQGISDEVNKGFEEYRARVVGDLAKLGNVEIASEEMKTALRSALQKGETEIVQRMKSAEEEIARKTSRQREMMKTLAKMDRF